MIKHLLILCLAVPAWSRPLNTGFVRGRVTDQENQPLIGANVAVENTLLGSSTDEQGRYFIAGVKPGSLQLRVSYMGYETRLTSTMTLDSGDTLNQDIRLEAAPVLMNPVVVTASKHPQALRSSHQSVSVIPERSLSGRQIHMLQESLIPLPGVHLNEKDISIRGSSGFSFYNIGSRVALMIDGIPVLTPDFGGINWESFPLLDVDHIEVVKGAGSALYGSSAMGGIVNIITRKPEPGDRFSFRAQAGIYDRPHYEEWKWTDRILHYERADLAYTRSAGPVGIRAALTRRVTTGYMENGQAEQWNASGKLNFHKNRLRLDCYAAWMQNREGGFIQWLSQNDPFRVPPGNREDEIHYQTLNLYGLAHWTLSSKWGIRFRISALRSIMGNQLTAYNPGAFKPGLSLGTEIQADWIPHKNHHAVMGAEIRRDLTGSQYFGNHEGLNLAVFLQNRWRISPGLEATLGMRWDTHRILGEKEDHQINPKSGLVAHLGENTSIRASIGSGFRAATVFERYIEADYAGFHIIPNPKLESETSWFADIGFHQRFGRRAFIEICLFESDYRNLIEPVIDFLGTIQFRNTTRARITGCEGSGEAWIGNLLRVYGAVTWILPRDVLLDQDLPYRPRLTVNSGTDLYIGPWRLQAELRYASRVRQVSINPLDPRVPLKLIAFRLERQWRDFIFQFSLNNAFNYHYTQVERRMGEIRNAAFTLIYSGRSDRQPNFSGQPRI
ncbi:MAG TPA: TonB-dependent receptor [bacterium]|nr:TonB-dependent receptor [bacterium]